MNTLYQTQTFNKWIKNLKDLKGRARILARIRSAELGHFGDCAPVGEGISEMRVHYGAGYRMYYWQEGSHIYWLLAGGDKSSQQRDIEKAKKIRQEIKDIPHGNTY